MFPSDQRRQLWLLHPQRGQEGPKGTHSFGTPSTHPSYHHLAWPAGFSFAFCTRVPEPAFSPIPRPPSLPGADICAALCLLVSKSSSFSWLPISLPNCKILVQNIKPDNLGSARATPKSISSLGCASLRGPCSSSGRWGHHREAVLSWKMSTICQTSVFVLVVQSGLTLCDPIDYSLQVSSVHGILQARILECGHSLFQGIFATQGLNPGLLHCRQILYAWATREAKLLSGKPQPQPKKAYKTDSLIPATSSGRRGRKQQPMTSFSPLTLGNSLLYMLKANCSCSHTVCLNVF